MNGEYSEGSCSSVQGHLHEQDAAPFGGQSPNPRTHELGGAAHTTASRSGTIRDERRPLLQAVAPRLPVRPSPAQSSKPVVRELAPYVPSSSDHSFAQLGSLKSTSSGQLNSPRNVDHGEEHNLATRSEHVHHSKTASEASQTDRFSYSSTQTSLPLTYKNRPGGGETTMIGSGESYRPRPRSPARSPRARSPVRPRSPLRGSYRERDVDRRSPQRRQRSPPYSNDSYNRGGRSPRRRSRSPVFRNRERTPPRDIANWRRTRSPPRRSPPRARSPPRRFSPRRDSDRRPKSPPRGFDRYDIQSDFIAPYSSDPRRSRSPYDRDRAARARSPPPSRTYRERSRSPERQSMKSSDWRRRSMSPHRDSERSSGKTSSVNSRRNSPPVHPSRLTLTQPTSQAQQQPLHSPPSQPYRETDHERPTLRDQSSERPTPKSPPRGPSGALRAPTGPSNSRNFSGPLRSPNVGRSDYSTPVAMLVGPRGNPTPRGPSYMYRGRGTFTGDRSSRNESSSWGNAPPLRPSPKVLSQDLPVHTKPIQSPSTSVSTPPSPRLPVHTSSSTTIPTGPRAGPIPLLRSSSSIYHRGGPSTHSGSRALHALSNIPPIIPGGRIDPTALGITSDVAARLKKRQEEEEVLRADLQAKEEKLRRGLRTWRRLERESKIMAGRTELSEMHVRLLAGEGVGWKAF